MEDILASIKKVIAEEKELRTAVHPAAGSGGSPVPRTSTRRTMSSSWSSRWPRPSTSARRLIDQTRRRTAAAIRSNHFRPLPRPCPPAPPVNPLEEMVREMLRPILKQWLDEHLPQGRRRACEARNHADYRPAALSRG